MSSCPHHVLTNNVTRNRSTAHLFVLTGEATSGFASLCDAQDIYGLSERHNPMTALRSNLVTINNKYDVTISSTSQDPTANWLNFSL